MKVLTIIIPCYNSQDYLHNCLDSLLPCDDDIEILIVNDGSTDNTLAVATDYQSRHPDIVRVVSQENAGHGGAVNTGIQLATGTYIKVIDSDDWVEATAYGKVLDKLRSFSEEDGPDVVITNYVYEKVGKKHKKVMRYKGILPEGRPFTWDEVKNFKPGQYMLMHSIIYRSELLRKSGLMLPKNTFYVDNLYAFVPLQYVDTLYYLDVDLYRYFIGRDGQSVQEQTMIRRIDQQLAVNKTMSTSLDLDSLTNAKQIDYLLHYFEIVTMISSILLIRSGTDENFEKLRLLWDFIKETDMRQYSKLRYGALGRMIHLPGSFGRAISLSAYRISQKLFGFN